MLDKSAAYHEAGHAVIAVAYLALSFLFRGAFWLVSQIAFVRKRKLGTNL